MKRLTTRGHATAEAIRDREDFNTSGALKGRKVTTGQCPDGGRLLGSERENYYEDMPHIDYVVTSYDTPIAWHTPGGWYKVKQKFSLTTSKHQGNLYLIED
jgi:hypothetical protein